MTDLKRFQTLGGTVYCTLERTAFFAKWTLGLGPNEFFQKLIMVSLDMSDKRKVKSIEVVVNDDVHKKR